MWRKPTISRPTWRGSPARSKRPAGCATLHVDQAIQHFIQFGQEAGSICLAEGQGTTVPAAIRSALQSSTASKVIADALNQYFIGHPFAVVAKALEADRDAGSIGFLASSGIALVARSISTGPAAAPTA